MFRNEINKTFTQDKACTIQTQFVLKGSEYNPSIKGKGEYTNEIVSTNCESEKWDTEVEKDKKVSFNNVTNAG